MITTLLRVLSLLQRQSWNLNSLQASAYDRTPSCQAYTLTGLSLWEWLGEKSELDDLFREAFLRYELIRFA